MAKGKRNRKRRRMEREQMDTPVTAAEVYCVQLLTAALKEAGVERDGPEWNAHVERAKVLLQRHRQEVRHMYADRRSLLKEWLFAQLLSSGTGVTK